MYMNMKVLFVVCLLSVQLLSQCDAFSVPTSLQKSKPSRSTRSSDGNGNGNGNGNVQLFASGNSNSNSNNDFLVQKATSFAAVMALGWSLAASASFAATATDVMLPTTISTSTTTTTTTTSSLVVSLGSSDFVDFSMPSYEEASRAEVNSNLKGDKYLLGEASKSFTSSSIDESSTRAVVTKSADELKQAEEDKKVAKANAKAEQKAAREAQLAAAEAAVAK